MYQSVPTCAHLGVLGRQRHVRNTHAEGGAGIGLEHRHIGRGAIPTIRCAGIACGNGSDGWRFCSGCDTKRNASLRNLRNRTSEISQSTKTDRSHKDQRPKADPATDHQNEIEVLELCPIQVLAKRHEAGFYDLCLVGAMSVGLPAVILLFKFLP